MPEKGEVQDLSSSFKKSLLYLYKASYLQFSNPQDSLALVVGAPLTGASFFLDHKINKGLPGYHENDLERSLSSLAVISTFPLLPLGLYCWGRQGEDHRLVQFSIEYFSTMYLALLESAGLSFVPTHRRPSSEHLNRWERNFRGPFSFPSGHVIPLAALTAKTLEFYGPLWAMGPAIATSLVGLERIQDQKHYLSDVVGGIVLAFLSSSGVSKAAAESEDGGKAKGAGKEKGQKIMTSLMFFPGDRGESVPYLGLSLLY